LDPSHFDISELQLDTGAMIECTHNCSQLLAEQTLYTQCVLFLDKCSLAMCAAYTKTLAFFQFRLRA